MKSILKIIAIVMLVSVPTYFATAKPEEAPGVQKKTLQIFNVSVDTTATTATISWETNFPSDGSVFISNQGIFDKNGTHHSVTIPFLSPGIEYHVRIESFSEVFGAASSVDYSFTL